jgi:hypothetical protein
MRRLLLALLLAISLPAQTTTHGAVISWAAPPDADATTTYIVWRINTLCPGQPGALTLSWTQVATHLTTTSYTDANLKVGSYCYAVSQTQGVAPATVRSKFSNLVGATVTPEAVRISGSPAN